MMGWRTKLKGGYEWDLIFGRRFYNYLGRPGVAAAIKRRMRRRARRQAKRALEA